MWPLFLGFRLFNRTIIVKSNNERVWSSKTKATKLFWMLWFDEKSISKVHKYLVLVYSLVNTASKLEFWFPSEPPVCSILLDLCALGHQRWGSFGPDLIICDLSWFARQKEKSATPLPDGGDLVVVVVVTQGGVSPYYYYYAKNYVVHSNPQYNEPRNSEFCKIVN